jgi:uncharacterized protein (TIGR02231 family)
MRPFLFSLALVPAAFPLTAFADTIEAEAKISQVTLYPWGASVTREVSLDLTPGAHQLLIPGLPANTDPSSLRVAGTGGVTLSTMTLMTDRLPVTERPESAEVIAAKAEIGRLKEVIRSSDQAIAAVQLKAKAADEQLAFLRNLSTGKEADPAQMQALAAMMGSQALELGQTKLAAEAEAQTMKLAQVKDQDALKSAEQALAALQQADADKEVLALGVEGQGPTTFSITSYTDAASWAPVYDLRLTRGDSPSLTLDRGITVSQNSGEDWRGVDLVLSTARPSDQSAPGMLWPDLRRIGDPMQPGAPLPAGARAVFSMSGEEASDTYRFAAAAKEATGSAAMMGATLTYHYATPVDLRDGVDGLRLALDQVTLAPQIRAEAVPARDMTAYLTALTKNTSGEVLLPGRAMLFADGALVGSTDLPLTAAGAEMTLGFGPIDGLRLTRTVSNNEGDRGIISKSNQKTETVQIKVENLTQESWPLYLMDQVPYSEQEDLSISYTASPAATETDVKDQKGVLAWESEIAAGETQEISIETTLSWPSGKVLQ